MPNTFNWAHSTKINKEQLPTYNHHRYTKMVKPQPKKEVTTNKLQTILLNLKMAKLKSTWKSSLPHLITFTEHLKKILKARTTGDLFKVVRFKIINKTLSIAIIIWQKVPSTSTSSQAPEVTTNNTQVFQEKEASQGITLLALLVISHGQTPKISWVCKMSEVEMELVKVII